MSTATNDSAAAPGENAANQIGQLRAVHEALQRLVAERAATAGQTMGKAPPAAPPSALQQELAELRSRNQALESQLDAAQSEAANRPAIDQALSAGRAVLDDARAQIESLQQQLAAARTAEEKLRSTVAQHQLERQTSLGELHVLRCRTMELAEELSRERQHSLAERQLWHNELTHWRKLLESHFVRLSGQRVPPDPRSMSGLDLAPPKTDEPLNSILLEHHPKSDS